MSEERGMFFVIEGSDGSGKKTQFGMLRERLEHAGFDVVAFDFPQYDQPSSHFVRRYLKGDYGTAEQVGPYTGSLFYALDRYEAAKEIQQALDAGKIVLANRYTASNMAHQGGKFANIEERRGFYIWLDNLEFMLLKIPRPDISLVLRVPATIAQGLKSKQLSAENKQLDLHESDLGHLEASIRVYDELCQLFPRDFKQIDCVRSGAMMTSNHIHQMIWEIIQPHLPQPPTNNASIQPLVLPSKATVAVTEISEQHSVNVSILGALKLDIIENVDPTAVRAKNDKTKRYYIPEQLSGKNHDRYTEVMDSLFELYDEMLHRLPAEHAKLLQSVIPVAMQRSYIVDHDCFETLLKSDFTEAKQALNNIGVGVAGDKPVVKARPSEGPISPDLLPGNFDTAASDSVTLLSVSPRSELDLVPRMVYPGANLSLTDITTQYESWTYDQKAAIFLAYLASSGDDAHALKNMQYTWEIVAPFLVMHDLQTMTHGVDIVWQQLTPRHGYTIPEPIEEAGLADLYERSFDISLELYSDLQAAGFVHEAQYATLQGHVGRFLVTLDGCQQREIYANAESTSDSTIVVIDKIKEKSIEIHPLSNA